MTQSPLMIPSSTLQSIQAHCSMISLTLSLSHARTHARTHCRIPGFLESDEQGAMQRLCDAFLERDGEAVVEACGDIVFRTMETDVSSLSLFLCYAYSIYSGTPL